MDNVLRPQHLRYILPEQALSIKDNAFSPESVLKTICAASILV